MTTGYEIPFRISSMVSQTRHPIASFRWLRRAGTAVLQQAFEVVEHEGSITMRSFKEWVDVPLVEDDAGQTVTHHEPGEFGEGATMVRIADTGTTTCDHIYVSVPLDPARPRGAAKGRCRRCGFEPSATAAKGGDHG